MFGSQINPHSSPDLLSCGKAFVFCSFSLFSTSFTFTAFPSESENASFPTPLLVALIGLNESADTIVREIQAAWIRRVSLNPK